MFEHNDDIISLTQYENLVITGQVGLNPSIVIWDFKNMNVIATLEGTLTHGIGHLAVSSDGKYLAASALDPNHAICIYNLQKILNNTLKYQRPSEYIIATGNGPDSPILDLKFDNDTSNTTLIAACVQGLYFFTNENNHLFCRQGKCDP